jgi:hypothetical protein
MRTYVAALRAATALIASQIFATPPNRATLDGRPIEYDDADLRGAYTGGGGFFGPGNSLGRLYVTWDTNDLFIALEGAENGNKLVVMLDADPGVGTGATTTTNWTGIEPSYIKYNDVGWRRAEAPEAAAFGLDYMLATEGFYNSVLRIAYDGAAAPDTNTVTVLFDEGNGASPRGTPIDMAVLSDDTGCGLKGFEARIPWRELYTTNGGSRFGAVAQGAVVPAGATLRLFANLHNNNPDSAYSANDAVPQQTSPNASHENGLLTTDNYIDVPVDGDGDGIPDVLALPDANAPHLVFAGGLAGGRTVFAAFNELVSATESTNPRNWFAMGQAPASVHTTAQPNAFVLQLTNDLPAAGGVALVAATNIADGAGNSRFTEICLFPAASGLTNAVTVRFQLETSSGLGLNPGASAFFVNGSAWPLEFGYPPAASAPLDPLSGSVRYRDVVFPPGTPSTLRYKYSGLLAGTGTNTYEAVRLVNYADAARQLTLPPDAAFLVVTDHLGAAAAPFRDPGTNTGFGALYVDPQRADAGVRERVTMTFQLDLLGRDLRGVTRVFVQGSDPLRGFNVDNSGVSDFAGNVGVGSSSGGITLFDDGSNGDLAAGDKVFSRRWSFTPSGTDAELVPDAPNSLVGGDVATLPYGGFGWVDGRSPRSIVYKFYALKANGDLFESPSQNIELYIEGSPTNVLLAPVLWDNPALPPPLSSNTPTVVAVNPAGEATRVVFTNLPTEQTHGVQVSTDLRQGWLDYGQRVSGPAQNGATASVRQAGFEAESFRIYAGAGNPGGPAFWTPNPVPSTGATLYVEFDQNHRNLAGERDVRWFGRILGGPFTNLIPMTFLNRGLWAASIPVPPATNDSLQFLFTNPQVNTFDKTWNNRDFYVNVGGRVTWTPEMPAPGGTFTVTYNPAGSPLATATQVLFHHGFDNFQNVTTPAMTNVGTGSNLWTISIAVSNAWTNAVDWVFQNGAGTFDNNSGNDWRAFIQP